MRRFLIAVLFLAAAGLSAASYHQVEAMRLQSEIATVCGQIPAYVAALDYTIKTWPSAPNASQDTDENLAYFGWLVRNDAIWCDKYSSYPHPTLAANTMLWHFGQASQALAQYQTAAQQGGGAVPAPTVAPQPPAATPTPAAAATGSACAPDFYSNLAGRFPGFAYGNTYSLANGQVWRQTDQTVSAGMGALTGLYVHIFRSGSGCLMQVGLVLGQWQTVAALVERVQ